MKGFTKPERGGESSGCPASGLGGEETHRPILEHWHPEAKTPEGSHLFLFSHSGRSCPAINILLRFQLSVFLLQKARIQVWYFTLPTEWISPASVPIFLGAGRSALVIQLTELAALIWSPGEGVLFSLGLFSGVMITASTKLLRAAWSYTRIWSST